MLFVNAIGEFKAHMEALEWSYESVKGYYTEIRLLNNYITQKYNVPVYVRDLSRCDIEEYLREHLKERGYSGISRNRSLYIIRSFLKYCVKRGYVKENVAVSIEPVNVNRKERIYISHGEVMKLISAIDRPLAKIMVITLYYTGMRISECINLIEDDVDLEKRIIKIRNTKGKRDRMVPINDELYPVLKKYCGERRPCKNNWFFMSNNRRRVSADYVNMTLNETVDKLKWKKRVTCHIIRHSFASNLVKKNVNVVHIQRLLGHSDLSTTSIYTHTNMSELRRAVNLI
jgi:integrase/recombinase XerD